MFNGKLFRLYNWLLTTYSILKKDPFWLNSFPNCMYMLYKICIIINVKYGEDETICVKVLFYYILLHGFFSCKFQYKKMIYCLRKDFIILRKLYLIETLKMIFLQKSFYFKLWRMKERNIELTLVWCSKF